MALLPYIEELKEGVDRINWANDEMKNTLHESIEKNERGSRTN